MSMPFALLKWIKYRKSLVYESQTLMLIFFKVVLKGNNPTLVNFMNTVSFSLKRMHERGYFCSFMELVEEKYELNPILKARP